MAYCMTGCGVLSDNCMPRRCGESYEQRPRTSRDLNSQSFQILLSGVLFYLKIAYLLVVLDSKNAHLN